MEENVLAKDSLLSEIWFIIKRHIILILAVIIVCTAGGFAYSYIKKPAYTTSQQVVCVARDEVDGEDTGINFNIMNAYIGTIVDFSDEGVVVDRANFYYVRFNEEVEKDPSLTINKYVEGIINTPIELDSYNTRDLNQEQVSNKYILEHSIKVVANVSETFDNDFAFSLEYTDGDETESQIKAKIIALALRRELEAPEGTVDSKYFDGINITISDLGSNGTVSNIARGKSTAIGAMLGLVISIIICIIVISDSSLKTKEDLEQATNAPVFACIAYNGGKK